jgi:hypothetical protein
MVAQDSKLTEGIKKILLDHQAYTKIVYTDTDDRVTYECDCGARESDTDLLGADWLATHRTDLVVSLMSNLGVRA